MGLFDSIIGSVLGGGAGAGALESVLGSLLGGGGAQPGGAGSGLTDILQKMQQMGLGDIAKSWVGNGPNQPIDPSSLGQVLGQNRINDMAQQTGLNPDTLLKHLSQLLPHAVDQATPNGQVPGGVNPFDGSGIDSSRI